MAFSNLDVFNLPFNGRLAGSLYVSESVILTTKSKSDFSTKTLQIHTMKQIHHHADDKCHNQFLYLKTSSLAEQLNMSM